MNQEIAQFPHCDPRILHRQNSCEYCDMYPEWQKLREIWGIAFTGHSTDESKMYPDHGLIPCPSEWSRPLSVINKWGGNVAKPHVPGH